MYAYPHMMTAEQVLAAAKSDSAAVVKVVKIFRSKAVLLSVELPGRGVSKIRVPSDLL